LRRFFSYRHQSNTTNYSPLLRPQIDILTSYMVWLFSSILNFPTRLPYEAVTLNLYILQIICGPGSLVGIAIDYWMDGPGIEFRWGLDFSHTSRPAPGPHPASCTMGTGSFLGVKRPERGDDHPPPSSAEVENEYSCTSTPPLGYWWPV
jgi:hypothetical protein